MPIYEYRCTKGHTFDVMQRMGDDPVTKCQICGSPVQRVFHPPSVHFKGSGFYNTDYGTRKRSREVKESGGDGAGKEAASTTSDSKSSSSDGGSSSNSGSDAKKSDKAKASSS